MWSYPGSHCHGQLTIIGYCLHLMDQGLQTLCPICTKDYPAMSCSSGGKALSNCVYIFFCQHLDAFPPIYPIVKNSNSLRISTKPIWVIESALVIPYSTSFAPPVTDTYARTAATGDSCCSWVNGCHLHSWSDIVLQYL